MINTTRVVRQDLAVSSVSSSEGRGHRRVRRARSLGVAARTVADSMLGRRGVGSGNVERLEDRRLFSAGQVLSTLATDVGSLARNDTGTAVVFDSLGRAVLSGNAGNAFAFVRYNAAGTSVLSSGVDNAVPGSGPLATALTLGTTGDVYVGGFARNAVTATSQDDFIVRRYDPSTGALVNSAATRFGTTNVDQISALVTMSDGRILAVGTSAGNFALAMYNADLTLDTTFGTLGQTTTNIGPGITADSGIAVVVQPDGKIVVAGNVNTGLALVRYSSTGTLDTSLNGTGIVTMSGGADELAAAGVALQADGQIVLAATNVTSETVLVYRVSADGSTVNSVSLGAGIASGVLVQPHDQRVVVSVANGTRFQAYRLNTNLTPDTAFDGDGSVLADLGTGVQSSEAVAYFTAAGVRRIALGGTAGTDFGLALLDANIDPVSNPVGSTLAIATSGSRTLSASILNVVDADDSDASTITLTFDTSAANGFVALVSAPNTPVSSVTLAQVNANQVVFRNNGTSGPATLTYVVADAFGGTDTTNTLTFSAAVPTLIYVNDDWASSLDGTIVGGASGFGAFAGFTVGVDAYGSVQAALNAVAVGGEIRILDGTYDEDVTITKANLAVRGEPGLFPTLRGAVANGLADTVFVGANGVLVEGLKITRSATPANWYSSDVNNQGVTVGQGLTDTTLRNNIITGNRNGLNLNNTQGVKVLGNLITDNRTGIQLNNNVSGLVVEGNYITNNWTMGILFGNNSPQFATTSITVRSNAIFGNWYGGIVNRYSGAPSLDFSGNWFGTANPTYKVGSSTEAGYASSPIPATQGGVAVAPVVLGEDVIEVVAGVVDFTPFLASGPVTTPGTISGAGFVGDFSHLIVTDKGGQSGSLTRIAEAVSKIVDGSLVGAARLIEVRAGEYRESIVIDRPVRIEGPNVGVAGTGVRGAEAVVRPLTSNPDVNTGSSIVSLESNNVTIDGLVFDGDIPSITSGVTSAGVDVDSVGAIEAYGGVSDFTLRNSVVRHFSYASVVLYNYYNGGAATSRNTVSDNLFSHLGTTAGWGMGVLIYNNNYAKVVNNTFDATVRVGVQTGNYYQANPDVSFAPEISGNTINAYRLGIFHNLAYTGASTFTLANNTITASPAPMGGPVPADYKGILVSSLQSGVDAVISGNVIDMTAVNAAGYPSVGVWGWNLPTTATITVAGGSITGGSYGVRVDNYEGYSSNGAAAHLEVSGVAISGATVAGIAAIDSPSNTNGSAVSVTVNGATTVSSSAAGVLVQGADASATVGNASISTTTNGVYVLGGAATLNGPSIYNNTVGTLVDTGSASFTAVDFDEPGNASDNVTDVKLNATAGVVSFVGSANLFGGNSYFIDNASSNAYDFTGNTAGFEGLTSFFRMEDQLIHRVQYGTSAGLIRLDGTNVFVSTPGTGVSDETIQGAIDAIPDGSSGWTVNVEAGTFAEWLTINESVTILGAQAGVDPRATGTLPRPGGETVITAPGVDVLRTLAYVAADNVTIDGVMLDGSNPSLGVSVETSNGVDLHAGAAVAGYSSENPGYTEFAVDGLTVRNNVVRNFNTYGVALGTDTGIAVGNNLITRNVIDNLGYYRPASSPAYNRVGVVLYNNGYASVTDNDFTRVNIAVQTNNFYRANPGVPAVVSGNDVEAEVVGLWDNLRYQASSPFTFSGNTVAPVAYAASKFAGIFVTSVMDAVQSVLSNNTVAAGWDYGYYLWNNWTSAGVTVSGGTVTGATAAGILLTNDDLFGASGADQAYSISGVAITNSTVGIEVYENRSGAEDTAVSVALNNVSVTGGDVGLKLSGNKSFVGGNTLGNTVFTGQSQYHVQLEAGAPGTTIDGSAASYDGVVGGSATVAEGFAIEDKLKHQIDAGNAAAGLIRFDGSQLYVTAPGTGLSDETIQAAVNAAVAGDTVNVQDGVYTENVTLNKAITLDGQTAGGVTLRSAVSNGTLINVTLTGPHSPGLDDVTIRDLAFVGSGPFIGDYGVNVGAAADFDRLTVLNSSFTGLRLNAVYVQGAGSTAGGTGLSVRDVVLQDSTFTDNGVNQGGSGDIQFFFYNGDATLRNLVVSNANTGARLGIQFRGVGGGNVSPSTATGLLPMGVVTLDNVEVTGAYRNQFIGIQRYATATSLALSGVKLGSATSQIWGPFGALLRFDAVGSGTLASPATVDLGDTDFRGVSPSSAQKTDLEFAPDNGHAFLVADGSGTKWDGVPVASMTLAQKFAVTDRVLDYTDALHPTWGTFKGYLQLDPTNVYVTPAGSIQRAIDIAPVAGTVNVSTGTFTGVGNRDLSVWKKLTVAGQGPTTVIDADGANGFVFDASGTAANDRLVVTNLAVTDAAYGLNFNSSVSFIGVAGVSVSASSVGLRVSTAGAVNDLTVTGSSFTGNNLGVAVENNLAVDNSGKFDNVAFETVTVTGSTLQGMYLEAARNLTLDNVTLTQANTTNGLDLNLKAGSYSNVLIRNSSFANTGPGTAVHVKGRNDAPSYNATPGSLSGLTIEGTLLTSTAVSLTSFGSGLSLGNAVSGVTLVGNSFGGTGNGVLYYVTVPQALSLGDSTFAASLGNYVINGTPFAVDGTNATYAGVLGSSATVGQGYDITDKIADAVDASGLGLVRIVPGKVFVTPVSFNPALGTTSPSVQRGVDAATAGDTVHVKAGVYVGNITINKALVLQGDGQGATILRSPASIGAADFNFSGGRAAVLAVLNTSSVTLRDFTLDGDSRGGSVVPGDDFVGIGIFNSSASVTDVTVTGVKDSDSLLYGMQRGRAIFVAVGDGVGRTVSVTNSTVSDFQKNGIDFRGAGLTGVATGNTATGWGPTPAIAQNGILWVSGAGGSASGNNVSGFRYTGAAPATSAGVLVFATAAPVVISSNVITEAQSSIAVASSTDVTASDNTITGTGGVLAALDVQSGGVLVASNNIITGATYGADVVAGASLTLTGGSITNSGIGVRVAGTASVTGVNFDAGTDNATDVQLLSTASGVSFGAGNAFGGSNYFVDNASAQAFDFTAYGPANYEGRNPTVLADAFAIEDLLRHKPDAGNAAAGLIRVVAGSVYVTTPGTGVSDETIQGAVDAASAGDTVWVQAGTYTENVLVNKNLSLLSASGRAATTIVGVSGLGAFGTIQVINNTTAFKLGSLTGNGFTVVGIDNNNPGIENAAVYFQGGHSNAEIRHNDIVANGDAGLITEFGLPITGFVIDNNIFSGQTFVGTPADNGFGNQFTTPNVPRQLVVMGSGNGTTTTANITFTNNQITGTAGGVNGGGEQGNGLVTIDALSSTFIGNTFAGTTTRFGHALRARGAGNVITGNSFQGTGMGATTTDLVLTQAGNVVAGNTFTSSAAVAISLSGATASASITANTITSYARGVAVGTATSVDVVSNVMTGNDIAVEIGNAVATVTGNALTGGQTGLRLAGNAPATVRGNDLTGNVIGAQLAGSGAYDLGTLASAGGNNFTGYLASSPTAGAIVVTATDAASGPQGAPSDIPAFGNVWTTPTPSGIEAAVRHDADLSTLRFVDFAALSIVSADLSVSTTSEGGVVSFDLSFTNDAQTHTLVINWGDGSAPQTVIIPGGTFTVSVPHTFVDDNPTATASDNYNITWTLTDSSAASADNLASPLVLTVNNVAPTLIGVTSASISEGGLASISMQVSDPGVLDVFSIDVNWGPTSATIGSLGAIDASGMVGDTTYTWTASSRTLVVGYTYAQNNPGNAPYTVGLAVTDDDTGTSSAGTTVTVSNVAPTLIGVVGASINEDQTATISATIADPGLLDTFTVTIDWQDGSPVTVLSLGLTSSSGPNYSWNAGTRLLTASHQYLDNRPADAPYIVALTVADSDLASTSTTATVNVANVAPGLVSVTGSTVNENGLATVTAIVADPGTLDSFSLTINWADGTTDTIIGLGAASSSGVIGGTAFTWNGTTRSISLQHTYLDDNPTGTASDNYLVGLSVTDNDGAIGTAAVTNTVDNVAPVLVSVTGSSITEGGLASVSFQISDPGTLDTFSATVNWADGNPAETVSGLGAADTSGVLSSGTWTWTAATRTLVVTHVYVDALPLNAPYAVTLSVSDDDTGLATAGATVNVSNDTPLINVGTVVNVNENGTASVTLNILDAGVNDVFSVNVNWADGSPASLISGLGLTDSSGTVGVTGYTWTASTRTLVLTHQYLNNLPANAPYVVSLAVSDNDSASSATTANVVVSNVAPTLVLNAVTAVLENGVATFSGTYSDPGTLDTHTLTIDWGDGSAPQVVVVSGGSFSLTHQYLDNPLGQPAGSFTISATLTDSDAATDTETASVQVSNVAPVFVGVTGSSIQENQLATVSFQISDPGTLDVFSATVNWQDGSPADVISGLGASNAAGTVGSTTFSWNGTTRTLVLTHLYLDNLAADAPYAVSLAVNDGDATTTTAVNVDVANVAPSAVSFSLPVSVDEGSSATVTILSVTDQSPVDTFTYSYVVKKNGLPFISSGGFVSPTTFTFTPDDQDPGIVWTVEVVARDDDGATTPTATQTLTVLDVAPRVVITSVASPIDEGSATTLVFRLVDPGAGDLLATGQVSINWGDASSPDIINAGAALTALRNGNTVTLTHTYNDNGVFGLTFNAVQLSPTLIYSGMGLGGGSLPASVTVGNVAPTGVFLNNTPTVAAGSPATVSWLGQADASPIDALSLRYTYGIDFDNSGTLDAPGELLSPAVLFGDATYSGSTNNSTVVIPGSYFTTPGTYTLISQIRDKDGGVTTQTASLIVTPVSFRVSSFTPNASGFDVVFNRAVDTSVINLFFSSDAARGGIQASDVSVLLGVTPVNGSLVFGPDIDPLTAGLQTDRFTWVRTGGVLANGTYNVTLRSGTDAFKDAPASASPLHLLDGNNDGTGGDNFVSSFSVSSSARVLSVPDFTRGAGQVVQVPATFANTPDLPVRVNGGASVFSVDFTFRFNPDLLTLDTTPVTLSAAAVTAGWSFTVNTTTPGVLVVSASGANPVATPNALNTLLRINASVPATAAYAQAQVLRITDVQVSDAEGLGDNAVHVASFLGDANASRTYSGVDATYIQRVAAGLDTGFVLPTGAAIGARRTHSNVDPVILGDVNSSGSITAFDASLVQQETVSSAPLDAFDVAALPPRPVFPPAPLTARPGTGSDAVLSLGTLSVPASVEAASTIALPVRLATPASAGKAVLFLVEFDSARLSLAPADVLATSAALGEGASVSATRVSDRAVLVSVVSPTVLPAGELLSLRFANLQPASRLARFVGGDTAVTFRTYSPDGKGVVATDRTLVRGASPFAVMPVAVVPVSTKYDVAVFEGDATADEPATASLTSPRVLFSQKPLLG